MKHHKMISLDGRSYDWASARKNFSRDVRLWIHAQIEGNTVAHWKDELLEAEALAERWYERAMAAGWTHSVLPPIDEEE